MSSDAKVKNPFMKAAEPFVCGGSAATFASIVIHPIDLAKVSLNINIIRLRIWMF